MAVTKHIDDWLPLTQSHAHPVPPTCQTLAVYHELG